jgi:hypothetical protein
MGEAPGAVRVLGSIGAALLVAALPCACSGSPGSGAGAGSDAGADSGTDSGTGTGTDADTDAGEGIGYPAPHPPMPHVVNSGGPVLAHPRVLPIVFARDPYQNDIETFASTLGQTAYWAATASEYGVGPLTGAPVVVVPDAPPAAITDPQVAAWLSAKMAAGALPLPDGSTIYSIYYPAQTVVTTGNGATSCAAFYGYHDEGTAPNGAPFPYAIMPRCHNAWQTDLANLTDTSSHEFLEASTDPLTRTAKAYYEVDPDHYAWAIFASGPAEIGDMCSNVVGAPYYAPQGFPYLVQRTWSNASAAAGHDPCVPALPGPFVNAVPVLNDVVTIDTGAAKVTTRGARIPVGQTRTVEIDLYSDAPTSGPWKVQALDLAQLQMKAPSLNLALDRSTGQNGDKLSLSITPLRQGTYGLEVFFLVSAVAAGREGLWVGLVSNE